MILQAQEKEFSVKWEKSFGDSSKNEVAETVILTSDNNLLIVGNYEYKDYWHTIAWISKTDLKGNLLWKKDFKAIDKEDANIYDIIETSNNEYLVVGENSFVEGTSRYSSAWIF